MNANEPTGRPNAGDRPESVDPDREPRAGNRGPEESSIVDASEIYAGGDRGEHSGVHKEQSEAVRGTPGVPRP